METSKYLSKLYNPTQEEIKAMLKLIPLNFPIDLEDLQEIFYEKN